MATLKQKYDKEILPKLKTALGLSNVMQVPRLEKISVNMGFGIIDKDEVKLLAAQLAAITGQKPVVVKSKKSISNFKLREGLNIGAKVTLRRERMYEFMERLIVASLPRIRDFRGIPKDSFDGRGNYTFGITDQTIFPEVDPNNVKKMQGMDITFVTTANDDKSAFELLKLMGMPFIKG
jgi:large subunit ribosomal protein L5